MPIINLFNNSPDSVASMDAAQIAAICGNGHLLTNVESKKELREYLRLVEVEDLHRYADYCLNNKFDNGPYMLQDVINEFGRRLDFEVTNGEYKGSRNPDVIGFDGIWKLPMGESIIVEVKTTDGFNINLQTIDDYRLKLIDRGEIRSNSTNLIVVGRNTTDSWESQVRGSKYNWNTRIVGVDALSKMALIKVGSESPDVLNQIRDILRPVEYTRVDGIVEIVFTTSADKEPLILEDDDSQLDPPLDASSVHPLASKREAILKAFSFIEDVEFIKRKASSYSDVEDEIRIVVSISRKYDETPIRYWYAYSDSQEKYLEEAKESHFILGCLDSSDYFAIPVHRMKAFAKEMNFSVRGNEKWGHVKIKVDVDGYKLYLSPSGAEIDLTEFLMTHD